MAQIVPLTTSPNQAFQVQLSVDGRTLTLSLAVSFNTMAKYWILAIDDAAGNGLLDSIPLVTGDYPAANILAQYAYLGIGSAFVINASGIASDYPDETNLGTDFLLVWDDTPTP